LLTWRRVVAHSAFDKDSARKGDYHGRRDGGFAELRSWIVPLGKAAQLDYQ